MNRASFTIAIHNTFSSVKSQEDPLSNINAVPSTITEDFCGIEPVTLPPEEEETRRPPEVSLSKQYHELALTF